MKKKELFSKIMDEMEIESIDHIDEKTELKELEEWDSLASLILMTIADENFGVKLSQNDIKEISSVKSFMQKIGLEKFED